MPTLLLHGEADNDVPITQSEELYSALWRRRVETAFVRYPRTGHGATEPRRQLSQLERTVAWFDRVLRPGRRSCGIKGLRFAPYRLAELVDALGRRPASRAAGF